MQEKLCEYCKKPLTTEQIKNGNRFCCTSCSAHWRNKTFGVPPKSKQALARMSKLLKQKWKEPNFRNSVVTRMKENNPTKDPDVVQKIKNKMKGKYKNNFKYGNGKVAPAEAFIQKELEDMGYIYNYAIKTKLARDAFPEENYSVNYKPDFCNLVLKIAIEIDGQGHLTTKEKEIDNKKQKCLEYLGFKVFRYTDEFVFSNKELILKELKEYENKIN
jgi:very-short-patch-repair endonuclease